MYISIGDTKCEKCRKPFTPTASTQKWCESCLHKKCDTCGKLFKVRNKAKFETTIYCSDECRIKGWTEKYVGEKAPNYQNGNRSKYVQVVCSICEKKIYRQKIQTLLRDVFFCSGECKAQYMRDNFSGENNPKYSQIEKTCEVCKNTYKVYACEENTSRFCSKACRAKWQAKRMSGKQHPNWRGGISPTRSLAWVSKEYKKWRRDVFERDNYTCKHCGDSSGGNLNAHHIKPFAEYPELRYEVSNGITLCKDCHIKEHKRLKDIQSELSE